MTDHARGEGAALFDILPTTRAMRRLRPDPVPDALLERLVEAATWAPSGSNVQGYEFVIVTDRDQMARLAVLWRRAVDIYLGTIGAAPPPPDDDGRASRTLDAVRYQAEHLHEAPALVVCCYETPEPVPGAPAPEGVDLARLGLIAEAGSVFPGVQNLLLAARALGLGATVTITHLLLEQEWKAALGLPEAVTAYAVVPVGWPVGRFGPVRRRPAAEVIHRDRW